MEEPQEQLSAADQKAVMDMNATKWAGRIAIAFVILFAIVLLS